MFVNDRPTIDAKRNHLNGQMVLSHCLPQFKALFDRQILDQNHPDAGGVIDLELGLAEPTAKCTPALIAASFALHIYCDSQQLLECIGIDDEQLAVRVELAADYLCRVQRPSGLIDLRTCNYDSAPDTGFVVQLLAACLCWQDRLPGHESWKRACDKIAIFLRQAAKGLANGGFHTPNHRWVIASALAMIRYLHLSDSDLQPVIRSYCDERIDCNSEGVYTERSSCVYDAVSNRSLLMLYGYFDWQDALSAVTSNLKWSLDQFHPDGRIDTSASIRMDQSYHRVPITWLHGALWYLAYQRDSSVAVAVESVWRHYLKQSSPQSDPVNLFWLLWVLDQFDGPCDGVDDAGQAEFAHDISKWFETTGLGRVRRGDLSLSVVRDALHPIRIYLPGQMPMVLSARLAYFGRAGDFVVDRVDWHANHAVLFSDGKRLPRRPGYEMPLGRAIDPLDFDASIPERSIRPMPTAAMQWRLDWTADSLVCHFKTELELKGVVGHLAIDFPARGQWQCDDRSILCEAGQRLLLTGRYGRMQYDQMSIELGPGMHAHQCLNLRNSPRSISYEAMDEPVRILMPMATPVDHTFTIKWSV